MKTQKAPGATPSDVEIAANEVCDAANELVSVVGPRVLENDSRVVLSRGEWNALAKAVREHRRVTEAFLAAIQRER